MAFSKANRFAQDDQDASKWAKLLSHPARIILLKTLAQTNSCVCGTLANALPLAQSTVSQHLKTLRDSGLVTGEIEGPHPCYCIDKKALTTLQASLRQLLADLDNYALSCSCESPEPNNIQRTP